MERTSPHSGHPSPSRPGAAEPSPRLSPGDPLGRAAELLALSGAPLLPVLDGEGRLAGTLSRRELEAFLREAALAGEGGAEEALRAFRVEDAMDRRPVTALPGDSDGEAASLARRYGLEGVAETDGTGRFLRIRIPGPR